jgi:hypothetical protein
MVFKIQEYSVLISPVLQLFCDLSNQSFSTYEETISVKADFGPLFLFADVGFP